MFQIHFVLYQFDDRNQQIGVAQPAEDIFKDRQIFVFHTSRDAVAKWREHHYRYLLIAHFDRARDVKHIVIVRTGHTDHKVESGAAQFAFGLLGRSYLIEARRIAQAQFGIFVEYLFVYAPIVFQHKRIVGIGDQEYVENAAPH